MQTYRPFDVPLDRLHPDWLNPRGSADQIDTSDIEASLPLVGLLAPLIVREHPTESGEWIVVAGHRRLLALQRAFGHASPQLPIPCIDAETGAVAVIAAVENAHRQALDAFAEAEAIVRMIKGGMKPGAVGRAMQQSVKWVNQRAQLCGVIPDLRQRFHGKRISFEALPVIALLPPERQQEIEAYLDANPGKALGRWELVDRSSGRAPAVQLEATRANEARLEAAGVPFARELFEDHILVTDRAAFLAMLRNEAKAAVPHLPDEAVVLADSFSTPAGYVYVSDPKEADLVHVREGYNGEAARSYYARLKTADGKPADLPGRPDADPLSLEAMPRSSFGRRDAIFRAVLVEEVVQPNRRELIGVPRQAWALFAVLAGARMDYPFDVYEILLGEEDLCRAWAARKWVLWALAAAIGELDGDGQPPPVVPAKVRPLFQQVQHKLLNNRKGVLDNLASAMNRPGFDDHDGWMAVTACAMVFGINATGHEDLLVAMGSPGVVGRHADSRSLGILRAMKSEQLRAYGQRHGIEFPPGATKARMITALREHGEPMQPPDWANIAQPKSKPARRRKEAS